MLTRLFETNGDKVLAAARIILGLLFFIQGAQWALGWFGGAGIHDINALLRLVSLSAPLVLGAALISFFGGIGLIVGLFARIAAVLIAVDTAFSVILGLIEPRLFLDWSITQGGAGIEYSLLALALALILTARGAGAFSLDRLLFFRTFHVHPQGLAKWPGDEIHLPSSNGGRVRLGS